jgi:hypothetical protein
MSALGRALALGAVAGLALVLVAGSSSGATSAPADRVLIVALPNATWADLARVDLPNLDRLLEESAVGDLTTRSLRPTTRLGDGYVTLGAGTRAVGDGGVTDGQAFGVDEPYGDASAGAVFSRRTGHVAREGLVHLGVEQIVERNESLHFDAEIGALGDALTGAGFDRAVIANADGAEPEGVPPAFRRQAVSALMGDDGRVPAGRVDDGLLTEDREAPFGVRLDNAAAARAFRDAWEPRSVVLVEASDLVRADVYRQFATPGERERLVDDALVRTDDLVGRLLAEVDPERDAVLLVGPAHPQRAVMLTVSALRAPGVEPGLLRSATTRRSGFVQLIDVAPTVLDLVGADAPSSMEGRSFEVGKRGGSAEQRREFLVDADEAARFRDGLVGPVTVVYVIGQIALSVGAFLVLSGRVRRREARHALPWLALVLLAFIPAVYLARLVEFEDLGAAAFWVFVMGVSLVLAIGYRVAGRDDETGPLRAALAVMVGLPVLDVVLGAPLHLNNAFGYSPTISSRFAGFNNISYSALASAALLLAALLTNRIGGRQGAWVGIAVLVVALVADGMPFWGSDVGGVLSMAPAFTLAALVLLGRRVRWRALVWAVAVLAVALTAFGALDLARAPERRTHFGQLLERVGDEGWSGLNAVLVRKLESNLGTLTHSVWRLLVPVVALLLVYLMTRSPVRLRDLVTRIPELRAALLGLAVLALLGYALNDSGIAVPGVIASVVNAVLVALLATVWSEREVTHAR